MKSVIEFVYGVFGMAIALGMIGLIIGMPLAVVAGLVVGAVHLFGG